MKFYREKKNQYDIINYIVYNKLTAIYSYNALTQFYRNGELHNPKNASYVEYYGSKAFYLNGKYYSWYEFNFTKESWRRFCKLQAFL